MAKKNEIAVVSETEKAIITSVIGGRMAQDIEFEQLDLALERLAAHTGELSSEERHSAAELITSFEQRVINTLEVKQSMLNDFQWNLSLDPYASYSSALETMNKLEPQLRILFQSNETAYAGLEDMMDEFLQSIEENKEYAEEHKPDELFIDEENTTPAEAANKRLEYKIAVSAFEAEMHRREFASRKLHVAFRKALKKNKEFKKFIGVLDKQEKATSAAVAITNEKASAAKMAILVSSEEIRKALKSFHEFAASI